MKRLNIKLVFNGIVGLFMLGVLVFACAGVAVSFSRLIENRERSKPTLNLCSAEAIQIGEDIEYVYLKIKK